MRRWLILIVWLTALACTGSWAAIKVRSMRDRSEVAKMTEKMKTVCVGRYLADLPAQAKIALGGVMLDGFEVEALEEREAQFRERISTREKEIAERGANPLRVTKLREEIRNINGIVGEEVLERVREYKFSTTYGFNWEARGVKEDPLQPYLSLELQTGVSAHPGGKPVDTSLHEDALLALWDNIASSIRLRKADFGPRSKSRTPRS
jgi:hypothetical protein